jgi:hypothetical protein
MNPPCGCDLAPRHKKSLSNHDHPVQTANIPQYSTLTRIHTVLTDNGIQFADLPKTSAITQKRPYVITSKPAIEILTRILAATGGNERGGAWVMGWSLGRVFVLL